MYNNVDFIMPLKNRSEIARRSIENAIFGSPPESISLTVVEDESENMLELKDFPSVRHFKVRTGVQWTRSGLLNFGVRKSNADCVAFWDADFLFSESFFKKYLDILGETDLSKQYLQILVTETDNYKSDRIRRRKIRKGTLWGGFYTYARSKLLEINAFDEKFIGWGWEEKDLNSRLKKIGYVPKKIEIRDFVFHMTHGDEIRNFPAEAPRANKFVYQDNVRRNLLKTDAENWGEFEEFGD